MFFLRSLLAGWFILVIGALLLPWYASRAADLRDVHFRLTRQAISVSTNAEIAFTTPAGVDAPTDTIALGFASGFNISALSAITDISMTYGTTTGDEISAIIGSTPGVGIWGGSISGNQIILSAPTNALPGLIPAGGRVKVKVGTWAGGPNQIANPAEAGMYAMSISGNFGDIGAGYTIIRATDDLQVTATVDNPDGGGGSGGSGSGPVGGGDPSSGPIATDGTAPRISDLRAESITPTSAVIRWTTDEPADARLEYGTSTGVYTGGSRERASRLTTHEIPLSGFVPETEYHVRVRARDVANNTRWSGDVLFRTTGLPREPIISDVMVSYIDDHQVIIRWSTNVDTRGTLELSPPPIRSFSETAFTSTHQLTLTGLSPAADYTFGIYVVRSTGELARAEGFSFHTLSDVTPPSNVVNFRGIYNTTSGLVELRWVNPTDVDFKQVLIMRMTSSGGSGVFVCVTRETACFDAPPVGQTRLTYRAVVVDLAGNQSTGAITLVTIPALTPPLTSPTDESDAQRTEADTDTDTRRASTDRTLGSDVAGSDSRSSVRRPSTPADRPGSDADRPSSDTRTDGSLPPILDPSDGSGSASATVSLDTTTGTPNDTSLQLQPEFSLSELVIAVPDAFGVRSALFARSVQVRLPVTGLPVSLAQAQIQTSGGSIYQLAYRESLGAYVSDFSFDPAQGPSQFVQMQAVATDGRRWEERFPFRVFPAARVLDATDDRRVAAVAGAAIELIADRPGGAVTRIEADAAGRYALIVPNGSYRLRVVKDGFRSYERRLRVENGLVVEDVRLRRSLRPLAEIWNPNASLQENLLAVSKEAVLGIEIGLEIARSSEVQAVTKQVVAPVVVAATVGTTASAMTGFTLFSYLRFIFTQPFLLLRRRKRQAWGVVYNALSKQPIELAVVRLLKAGTSFALQTRITDAQGRFSFFVPVGDYTIQVQKPGFQFPTQYLKDERLDVDLTDLYHGEAIKVTGPVTISANIPLDPAVKEETPQAILRRSYWRKLQSVMGVVGILVGVLAVIIDPSWKMAAFAVFQVAIYLLFRRLAIPTAPKRWGIVYDSDKKHPLAKAVVRIFDKKFNKLLETQITSKDGTYGFFAAKGLYYLTAEKPGYERYLSSDLDLTKATDTYIDHRFSLKRVGTAAK